MKPHQMGGQELLSLEVPGLAEKRPSVLFGDKVGEGKRGTAREIRQRRNHRICKR
jgi:hypothetical protein